MPRLFFAFICLPLLASCSSKPQKVQTTDGFSGCYSVEKNTPAELKISASGEGFVMQMKEPDGSWDAPEPMSVLGKDTAWQAYKVNAIGLKKDDLADSVVRTDGVLILSQLGGNYALKPSLDSGYVVNLFGATNTIYSVACDNEGVDLLKDSPHRGL